MPELDMRQNPYGEGYPHEEFALWIELYYLAVIFGASKEISSFRSEGKGDYSIFSSFRRVEYSEISRRLLSIAAICRNLMDNLGNRVVIKKKMDNKSVGKIWIDSSLKKQPQKLIFREACNKVLHAVDINFDLTKTRDIFSGYLNPKVYLYGYQKDVEWKSEINIYEFIKIAFYLT